MDFILSKMILGSSSTMYTEHIITYMCIAATYFLIHLNLNTNININVYQLL